MSRWSWAKRALFATDPADLSGIRGFGVRTARVVYLTVAQFRRYHGFERAGSLTFASIISLIPLVVLFFGFASVLGGGDKVVRFVVDHVVAYMLPPDSAVLDDIKSRLSEINSNIFSAGPGGLVNLTAIAGLLLISLGIFLTAERVFNRIWNVPGRRSILQKLTAFWVILTTSPFLIVASIWFGEFLLPEGGRIRSLTEKYWFLDTLYRFFVPVTIGFVAFTLVFIFLPATRVRVRSAALGGLTTAILWQLSKSGFLVYLERSGEVTIYYRQLAILPMFLIWMYVTWIVILLGGHLCYADQNLDVLSRSRRHDDGSRRFSRVFRGVYLLSRLTESFRRGETSPGTGDLAAEIGAPAGDLEEVARHLCAEGILAAGAEGSPEFTLARDPRGVPLREIVDKLRREEFPAEAEALGLDSGAASILRLAPAGSKDGVPSDVFQRVLAASHRASLDAIGDLSLDGLAGTQSLVPEADSGSESVDSAIR